MIKPSVTRILFASIILTKLQMKRPERARISQFIVKMKKWWLHAKASQVLRALPIRFAGSISSSSRVVK
jgi:hypothetical protein